MNDTANVCARLVFNQEQSDSDWGSWSLNNEGDLDQIVTDYKQDDLAEDPHTQSLMNGTDLNTECSLYDDYEKGGFGSGSEHTDNSEGEEDYDGLPFVKNEQQLAFANQKGMAACEYCGQIGIRDAFYSKTKKFCSMVCSRSFTVAQREGKQVPYQLNSLDTQGQRNKESRNYNVSKASKSQPAEAVDTHEDEEPSYSFDWGEYLSKVECKASPVSCFKHCPMADCWDNITVGMKVEVSNTDCSLANTVYWIATVMRLAGYKGQLRYEGFGSDSTLDFWLNFGHEDIHPVGWCAANGKSLVPPKTIQHKYSDWKDFLVKRLTGARTLPHNFHTKVKESLEDMPLKTKMRVEVVDKMCVSAMRVANVEETVGGRIRLHYDDAPYDNKDFWCHSRSQLIHPIGWSQITGHKLYASPEYSRESLNKATFGDYDEHDAIPDYFPLVKDPPGNGLQFQPGMKLEAIDPLNLSCVCVATVMKVLRNNYLMIGIDGSMAQSGADWFCYHATSPCIFPAGFAEINNIELTPVRGHKGPFKWLDYLKQTKSVAAPVKLFDKEIPKHGFKVGMKLEAVDLMEPRLICIGTITKVVGRLLRIHFDGWDQDYDQWIDCRSPDIYPVGWCELVDYHLEGPKQKEPVPRPVNAPRKRKTRGQVWKGPRKKRKAKLQTRARLVPQSSLDSSDLSQDSFLTDSPALSSGAGHPPQYSTDVTDRQMSRPHTPQQIMEIVRDGIGSAGICNTASPLRTDMPNLSPPLSRGGRTGCPTAVSISPPMPVITDLVVTAKSQSPGAQQLSGTPTTFPTSSLQSLSFSSLTPVRDASISQSPVGTAFIKTEPGFTDISAVSTPCSFPRRGSGDHLATSASNAGRHTPEHLTSPTSNVDSTPHSGVSHIVAHNIPRVLPGEPDKDCVGPMMVGKTSPINPPLWSVFDVCQFLRINDCRAHCESFRRKNIDGNKFMLLTKEQIVNLTGMKVGPSLKIYDLIQALKIRVAQQGANVSKPQTVTSPDIRTSTPAVVDTPAKSSQLSQSCFSPALKAQLMSPSLPSLQHFS